MAKRVEVIRLPPMADERALEQVRQILEAAHWRAVRQQLRQQES